jgi:hypothetical protein
VQIIYPGIRKVPAVFWNLGKLNAHDVLCKPDIKRLNLMTEIPLPEVMTRFS